MVPNSSSPRPRRSSGISYRKNNREGQGDRTNTGTDRDSRAFRIVVRLLQPAEESRFPMSWKNPTDRAKFERKGVDEAFAKLLSLAAHSNQLVPDHQSVIFPRRDVIFLDGKRPRTACVHCTKIEGRRGGRDIFAAYTEARRHWGRFEDPLIGKSPRWHDRQQPHRRVLAGNAIGVTGDDNLPNGAVPHTA